MEIHGACDVAEPKCQVTFLKGGLTILYYNRICIVVRRMGWNLDADCGCGEEMRSLQHLSLNCPLLSEGRPRLFGYLACWFPGLPPDKFDYRELVFDPDSSVVSELGRFFKHGNFIIWLLFRPWSPRPVRAAPGAWLHSLSCPYATRLGGVDHLGSLVRWGGLWIFLARRPAYGMRLLLCVLRRCDHWPGYLLELNI